MEKDRSIYIKLFFIFCRLLVIFCMINLLNYVDRGTIASKSEWEGDFKLNNFEDGVLSSAFMVGLLVASPFSHNPFRLIGVGLSVWTLATAGCGFSFDFWSITICRMFVGVGEASFISLAAPFIDDNAPAAQKTAWLAMFYMCIPTGIALGYVYGGLVGNHFNWRYAFWGESISMLPFAILGFVIKPLQLKERYTTFLHSPKTTGKEFKAAQKISTQLASFWKDLRDLLVNKVYVTNVVGYIAYNFVVGAYSYWGPKAGYSIYHMENADLMFGGITIICGILGTLAGGFILDLIQSTISNAFKLLSGATFLGAAFCFGAFCSKNLYGFIALFSIGELLIFATQGPVNYVCLHCVKPSMRPLSMAMSTVSIHIFGDVPSSPLVGVLQDHVHNWRETSLILTSILFIASGIWFVGIFLRSIDRFDEEAEEGSPPVERSNPQPVLGTDPVQPSEST
ncbi:unnamed protein product [Spirodela intermedia]|uniref:Major facilitator superfamily (MFS) profile domain-containing protein n=1 Tax=Spirodela intermedia TaxID=51605 RepID=A0A7I8I7L2_SPIIN|nr:unnamed protein product [Spirodela intermedia]CAA6653585.1 unnamed protein product [Spirodela intermedia]